VKFKNNFHFAKFERHLLILFACIQQFLSKLVIAYPYHCFGFWE